VVDTVGLTEGVTVGELEGEPGAAVVGVVGDFDGEAVTGTSVGDRDGATVGLAEGLTVGFTEGLAVAPVIVGDFEGDTLGDIEGVTDGGLDGLRDGDTDGLADGLRDGNTDGLADGELVGLAVGEGAAVVVPERSSVSELVRVSCLLLMVSPFPTFPSAPRTTTLEVVVSQSVALRLCLYSTVMVVPSSTVDISSHELLESRLIEDNEYEDMVYGQSPSATVSPDLPVV